MDLKNDYIGPEIDQVSISTHFFFIYLEGMTLSAGLPSMYFILFLHFFSIYWLQKAMVIKLYTKADMGNIFEGRAFEFIILGLVLHVLVGQIFFSEVMGNYGDIIYVLVVIFLLYQCNTFLRMFCKRVFRFGVNNGLNKFKSNDYYSEIGLKFLKKTYERAYMELNQVQNSNMDFGEHAFLQIEPTKNCCFILQALPCGSNVGAKTFNLYEFYIQKLK